MQMQHRGVPRQSARKPAGWCQSAPTWPEVASEPQPPVSTHEHQPPASLEQVKTRTPRKGSQGWPPLRIKRDVLSGLGRRRLAEAELSQECLFTWRAPGSGSHFK